MTFQNDQGHVSVTIDSSYTIGTANKPYDLTLNPRELTPDDLYEVFDVEIVFSGQTRHIALIGEMPFSHENCALLEGSVLTMMQNDAITQIDIRSCSVLRYRELGSFGSNFSIHRVRDGYIIHGEMAIIMLDDELNMKWNFWGRDIFATLSDKIVFELCENSIRLHDFEDNFYEIDYAGNLVSFEAHPRSQGCKGLLD